MQEIATEKAKMGRLQVPTIAGEGQGIICLPGTKRSFVGVVFGIYVVVGNVVVGVMESTAQTSSRWIISLES
jgi:hypothetical protein